EFLAARLGGREGGLGALADGLALVFGDGGQDVDGEFVGVWVVGCDELDAGIRERGDERQIAAQAVEPLMDLVPNETLLLRDGQPVLGKSDKVGDLPLLRLATNLHGLN